MPSSHSQPQASARRWPALLVMGVIVFITLPLFGKLSAEMKRSWDGRAEKNIVIVSEVIDGNISKIFFLQIIPESRSIQLIRLAADIPVSVVGGYGNYPLRSVFPLLRNDQKSPEFFPATYSLALHEIVDEVWTSERFDELQTTETVQQLFNDLLFYRVRSSLSLADRWWVYNFAQGLRTDQLVVKEAKTWEEWQKLQDNIQFEQERQDCPVAVVNTTGVSGFGSSVTKVIEESGLLVVRLTDTSQVESKTKLIFNDLDQCQEMGAHLEHVVPFPIERIVQTEMTQLYRAPVVLLLGSDFGQEFAKNQK